MKFKKLTTIFITAIISATMLCPTFAANIDNTSAILIRTENCSAAKKEFLNDIGTVQSLIATNFSRDNISFSDAKIGEPFKIENTNIYAFPILVNGKCERIMEMAQGENGKNHYAISEFYSDKLNDLSSASYAFIADDNYDIIAISNTETVVIDEKTDFISNNENGINIPSLEKNLEKIEDDLEVVDISDTFYDLSDVDIYSVNANGSGRWLGVPIIQQEVNTCWAAAMASILQYHGDNITVSNILSYTGKTGQSANYTEVQSYFSHYGYSSTKFNQGSLDFSDIKTEINNNRPLWQAIGKGTAGHAVVVEGYQAAGTDSSNTVSIMDPYYHKIVDCSFDYNSDVGGYTFTYYGYTSREGLYKIK